MAGTTNVYNRKSNPVCAIAIAVMISCRVRRARTKKSAERLCKWGSRDLQT